MPCNWIASPHWYQAHSMGLDMQRNNDVKEKKMMVQRDYGSRREDDRALIPLDGAWWWK